MPVLEVAKPVTPRLLRIKDAAAYLAASRSKVRDLIRDGKLRLALDSDDDPEKTPWKVTLDDLDAYIESILQTKSTVDAPLPQPKLKRRDKSLVVA
jgi:hypothetical protein